MATIDELRAKYSTLKGQGKTESTSKEMGKLSQQISSMKKSGGSTSSAGMGGFTTDVMAPQMASENAFINKFSDTISNLPKVTDIFNRLSTERGLPAIQEQSRGLQQTYSDIPQQEALAGKQFGISSSRLGKRIAGRQAELAPAVQKAQTQEQNVLSDVGNQLNLEDTSNQRVLQPFATEASFISNRLAPMASAWNTERAGQLSTALAKLQNGWNVTTAELKQIGEEAKAENDFERSKSLLSYQKQLGLGNGKVDDGY
jgi:hypothetical protein